jgi:acetyl-CoA carboxylase carboxyltransferase component
MMETTMSGADPSLRELLATVETERAKIFDHARQDAMQRLKERGRLSARQRIDQLVDRGTFAEIGGLVAVEVVPGGGPVRERAPADGVVVGTARVDGQPVAIISQDFSVFGGSVGRLGGTKTQRALKIAIRRGMPLVMLLDGGGHRIQDGQNSRHFANASSMFHDMARASGWIPMVALILGAGFAAPTNYSGLADFVVMVRGLSTMGLAGPALVKAGTGEEIDTEALGGSPIQVDKQTSALAARRRPSRRRGAFCRTFPATPAQRLHRRQAAIRPPAATRRFWTSSRNRSGAPTICESSSLPSPTKAAFSS